MREPHHPSCEELELPAVLHALSDPARLQIVRKLADGDECTCGTFELGLSKATLSHHFRVLRETRRGPNPPRRPQAAALPAQRTT